MANFYSVAAQQGLLNKSCSIDKTNQSRSGFPLGQPLIDCTNTQIVIKTTIYIFIYLADEEYISQNVIIFKVAELAVVRYSSFNLWLKRVRLWRLCSEMRANLSRLIHTVIPAL